jgi:hypothetical protein
MKFDFKKFKHWKIDLNHPLFGFVLYQDEIDVGKNTKYYTRASIIDTIEDDLMVVKYKNHIVQEDLVFLNLECDEEQFAWLSFDHENKRWRVGHIAYDYNESV